MRMVQGVIGIAALALLVGCSSPAAPGGGAPGGPDDGGAQLDPWLDDDLDLGAGVVTGEFMGVDMRGFSCDLSLYVSAESPDGVLPRANAGGSTGSSGIGYQDEQGVSTATGPGLTLTADATTVAITTDSGWWYIGDGGLNEPWTPSTQLTITQVPVPVDGCSAANLWAFEMMQVGTDPSEMIRAFTQDGLRNVATDEACAAEGIEWVPPNVPCDEFWERWEAIY